MVFYCKSSERKKSHNKDKRINDNDIFFNVDGIFNEIEPMLHVKL